MAMGTSHEHPGHIVEIRMKLTYLAILMALSPAAIAADAGDRSSPLDNNPACMDRTADASTGNCVVPGEGTPRHRYPPRSTTAGSASGAGTTSAPAAAPLKASPRKVVSGSIGSK